MCLKQYHYLNFRNALEEIEGGNKQENGDK